MPTDSLPPMAYENPQDYEIGGITVFGANFTDENALKAIAGFRIGDRVRVPGGEITRAMRALWNLHLFTDVQIRKEKTIGEIIFLEIHVQERPRLTTYSFRGAKKSIHDDLNEKVNKFLVKGSIVTENVKTNAINAIVDYYQQKGYLDADVTVSEITDTSRINSVRLVFDVLAGNRIKIQDITFEGNDHITARKLRKYMQNTRRKIRLFSSSKFIEGDYAVDKASIIGYYNILGFRDAQIAEDTIWRNENGELMIHLTIDEGQQYYFRNIAWKGNSIYETELLSDVLGIKRGDIYNQELLITRLQFSQDGRDVSTLYMDNGYLFFRVDPVEVAVVGDSIDLEIRIVEGPQATIDKVTIRGNDRTNEHVIRRELRTSPGDKFSRSDIIRSQREIINLGYFNPESLGINTPVNPQRGTVDIEYIVEEKQSDQMELSAGWGGPDNGVIGTLGVTFNNFSIRNIFNKETWNPLPQGDGQRLSLRAQTNGNQFQSYNISFTEPWLGGNKPNSLTVAGFYTILTNGQDPISSSYGDFAIAGASVSLGTRLKWPDDNFISTTTLNLQNMKLNNWYQSFRTDDGLQVNAGNYNNFSIAQTIARSTIDNPIFPRQGSRISLSAQFTPPYSLFSDKSYADLPVEQRYKWLEYHKWKFDAEWFTPIAGKLTLRSSIKFGMIGAYNSDIGISPFERFQLGGDGINNQQFGQINGTDIISLRGYEVDELAGNIIDGETVPTPIFNKISLEFRYPLSLNPNATIYLLAFAEGGNAWQSYRDFNPFDMKRSAGLGLRVYLPMFGLLGFDYGIGFDKENPQGSNFFNRYGNFNIILGFEPE